MLDYDIVLKTIQRKDIAAVTQLKTLYLIRGSSPLGSNECSSIFFIYLKPNFMIVTFFVGLSVESSRVGRFALQASTNTSTCYFALIS